MHNFLLRQFATNYGSLLRWVVAFVVGVIIGFAAHLGLELSDEQIVGITGAVAAFVSGAIGEYILRSQGKSISQIQDELQILRPEVDVDQWAGPETILAAKQAAATFKDLRRRAT
jgi:hypothetical protein